MRLALVADTFPPRRTSGAVQLRDLSREFVRQGHELTVLLPSADVKGAWEEDRFDGARVLRLRAPETKDIGHVRRTLAEFRMPFSMRRHLERSPAGGVKWDGVVWYSPSIFHGPLVKALKRRSGCRGYLIIRDIFPQWAADMGLMGRGLPYRVFDAVARYQYGLADIIGVQTPGNLAYFEDWKKRPGRRLEVLQNWLGGAADGPCSIDLAETKLRGRRIFVFAGNMGVAQGLDIIMQLVARYRERADIGFVFVGRGSEAARFREETRALPNVLFFDEIDPDEIPALYRQCDAGIVALDHRHRSHNIPGKFLTYMQSGLPVLACVNDGNDIISLIGERNVGVATGANDLDTLQHCADRLLDKIGADDGIGRRCRQLFEENYAVEKAVRQIVAALSR